jgi:DNA-binding XRE family transcriptional regulator
MNPHELIQKAKIKKALQDEQRSETYYQKTIAWFHYLGLLRHNTVQPRRFKVTLQEALKAGELEPRVLELIPAVMLLLPKALKFRKNEIPEDLALNLERIRKRQQTENFRGIEPRSYLYWLKSPVMEVARRLLNFHCIPRRRSIETHNIGAFIRESRMRLALTQKDLAKKYNLSLRIIRDLEQGKLDASLKATNDILAVFGSTLKI